MPDAKAEVHALLKKLDAIDDELAEMADEHSQLQGAVKATEMFMKTYQATLTQKAEGDSVAAKEVNGKALMHDDEKWTDYLHNVNLLGRFDTRYDYLDTRRSILQSAVKTIREVEFGQSGAPQGGLQDGQE